MSKRNGDEVSAVERAAGKLINICMAVMVAIRERGGNEGDLLKLDGKAGQEMVDEIASLLVQPHFKLTKMTLFYYLVKLCKFKDVDPAINAAHFGYDYGSFDLALTSDIMYLGPDAYSLLQVEKMVDERGFVEGDALDLLTWCITQPEIRKSSSAHLVALGARYHDYVLVVDLLRNRLYLRKISDGFDTDDEIVVRLKPKG